MKLWLVMIFSFLLSPLFAQKSEAIKWLLGTWKISTPKGEIVEQWKFQDDSTLVGRSVFVKAVGDTLVQESIQLTHRRGQWSYNPTAVGQNNNQPVAFTFIFLRGTEFIAENLSHDFPQRISYRRVKNQLFASIEGRKNGKFGKQNFDFQALD